MGLSAADWVDCDSGRAHVDVWRYTRIKIGSTESCPCVAAGAAAIASAALCLNRHCSSWCNGWELCLGQGYGFSATLLS